MGERGGRVDSPRRTGVEQRIRDGGGRPMEIIRTRTIWLGKGACAESTPNFSDGSSGKSRAPGLAWASAPRLHPGRALRPGEWFRDCLRCPCRRRLTYAASAVPVTHGPVEATRRGIAPGTSAPHALHGDRPVGRTDCCAGADRVPGLWPRTRERACGGRARTARPPRCRRSGGRRRPRAMSSQTVTAVVMASAPGARRLRYRALSAELRGLVVPWIRYRIRGRLLDTDHHAYRL